MLMGLDTIRRTFNQVQRRWRKHGKDFTDYWDNKIDEETRRTIVLTISPHTPISEQVQKTATTGEDCTDAVQLFPELTLDKCRRAGHIPTVCSEYFSTNFEERVMEAIKVVHEKGLKRKTVRGVIMLPEMDFYALEAGAPDEEYQRMLAVPGVVGRDRFEAAIDRVTIITIMITGMFAMYDDYKNGPRHESILKDDAIECSYPLCERTLGKDGGKLRPCKSCRQVAYCSRSCQKKNARAHEQECKKLKANAASKASATGKGSSTAKESLPGKGNSTAGSLGR